MSGMDAKQQYKIMQMFNDNYNGINERGVYAVSVIYYSPDRADILVSIYSDGGGTLLQEPICPSDFGLKCFIAEK